MNNFECPRCGHCCQAEVNKEAMQMALEALESDPISHAGLVNRKQAITALRQALETKQEPVALPCVYITSQKDGGNCYGDGTVYRGQRSKDSTVKTYTVASGDHNMHQKKKGNKKGLFDDVPLVNPDRDKAWEAFIKRKDVKAMMKHKEDFKFPVDGSYDLWCIVWEKAWHEGFVEGWKAAGGKTREP